MPLGGRNGWHVPQEAESMANPYESSATIAADSGSPGEVTVYRVRIRAFQRLADAAALLEGQYLLFVGICFVALLINSVAQGILLGPLMCGLHLCYADRFRSRPTSFERLFQGFQHFLPSFFASLIIGGLVLLIIGGIGLLTLLVMLTFAMLFERDPNGIAMPTNFVVIPAFVAVVVTPLLIYVPLVFVFALIADRKISAWQAIQVSWRGGCKNFWGIVWMFLVYGLLAIPCIFLCYVPFFFLFPLQLGAVFLLYQDVYGNAAPLE